MRTLTTASILSVLIASQLVACATDEQMETTSENEDEETHESPIITQAVSDLPPPGSIGTPIEGYAIYDSSIDSTSACGNGSKRLGMQMFSDYLARLGGMAGQNYAACQKGFHPRGMALDIYAGGFSGMQQVVNWLTANNNEMARRLAVVQIIFNSRIWRSYYGGAGKPQGGWGVYSGSDPHTSHIHVSFSEAGAQASTSFYRDVINGGGGGGATQSTWTQCGLLNINQQIGTDRPLPSCDGRFALAMQSDGNLVLYKHPGIAKWASNTYGSAARRAVMQGDGNFVAYTTGGAPIWHTHTYGWNGAILAMQNDGNVVLYYGSTPIWNTGTWE